MGEIDFFFIIRRFEKLMITHIFFYITFSANGGPRSLRVGGDKACALWRNAEHFGVFYTQPMAVTPDAIAVTLGYDRGRGPPLAEKAL